jgi:signal peptidase I
MPAFVRPVARGVGLGLIVAGLWLIWTAWPQSLGGRVAYVRVDGWSMNPTLHNGDLVVVKRQSSYRIGDAVAYRIPVGEFAAGALVVHRLIGGDGSRGFVTRGDNRSINDEWHPRTGDVVGRIRLDLPGAGERFAQASQPVWIGGLVALTTVFVMVLPTSRRERRRGRRRAAPDGPVRTDQINRPTFPSRSPQDDPILNTTHNSSREKAVQS